MQKFSDTPDFIRASSSLAGQPNGPDRPLGATRSALRYVTGEECCGRFEPEYVRSGTKLVGARRAATCGGDR